ncbi:hypothetical protein SAMN05421690_102825 [Nitrosomonas sp. Nm51]|uniref:hypothetical protein n=1 Tax=Nitrosomonas sp. Nm51 TaxID=133720 RepID=UPI0008AC981E|nr:hypothetical protein [Nitrosomonas sp. Nm51]SER46085.1 hypothetical protein SAMN05421690_102825 [Nitrosomonas sp. Nm51]
MNQINKAVATANETSIHNSIDESANGGDHRLISPPSGYKALWKLKTMINALGFLSNDLARLEILEDVALTSDQTFGLDAAIFSICQEMDDVRQTLLTANEVEVMQPVINNIAQAGDEFSFLLRYFTLEDGESREFYSGDIRSICLNLESIRDTLGKAYKQIEKFAQYNFSVDADLYKDKFSVITSIPDVINKLDILIKRFSGDQESKVEVLRNRKKTAKKLKRLCLSAWTLIQAVPLENKEGQRLDRAHNDLFHVFCCFITEGLIIDQNDLAVFSRILEDAKDNYGYALTGLLKQERNKSGGTH